MGADNKQPMARAVAHFRHVNSLTGDRSDNFLAAARHIVPGHFFQLRLDDAHDTVDECGAPGVALGCGCRIGGKILDLAAAQRPLPFQQPLHGIEPIPRSSAKPTKPAVMNDARSAKKK